MKNHLAGFRELEHTADWELEVWALELPALLEQAARGMYSLSELCLQDEPRDERRLEIHSADAEGLLVAFLSELLFVLEDEQVGFDTFHLKIDDNHLEAVLVGAPVIDVKKEIKAVTYHNLKIREEAGGLRVNIVFDV